MSMKWTINKGDFQSQEKRITFKTTQILKSHLDSVTSIYFNTNLDVMATASEDCIVNLWKTD
jgi:WD40 repeat protein